jgi:hypothetical protein
MSGMVTNCGASGEIPSESTAANKISLFTWFFFLIVILATYCRLYFGINFIDESFYIAIPLRLSSVTSPFGMTSPVRSTCSGSAISYVITSENGCSL